MDALIRRCFNVSKVHGIFWSIESMFLSFPGCTRVRQFLRNSIRNVCSSPHTLKRRGALIHHLVLDTVVRRLFSLDRLSLPHGLLSPKKVVFSWRNWHFAAFNFTPASSKRSSTASNWRLSSSRFFANIITSSKWIRQSFQFKPCRMEFIAHWKDAAALVGRTAFVWTGRRNGCLLAWCFVHIYLPISSYEIGIGEEGWSGDRFQDFVAPW